VLESEWNSSKSLKIKYYRQVSFNARVTFLKKVAQIEHKIAIKKNVFPEVRGLTTSSYIVYNYTTSGPVEYISTVYTEYIHIHAAYTHFQTIYTFTSNVIKI
jgi:hypothetical protein